FALDSVELEIDGKTVANYLYTEREIDALHRGGVHRLYAGNVRAGEHELVAFFTGRGPHGRDYRRGATLTFEKGIGPKYIELRISDRESRLQPEFVVEGWEEASEAAARYPPRRSGAARRVFAACGDAGSRARSRRSARRARSRVRRGAVSLLSAGSFRRARAFDRRARAERGPVPRRRGGAPARRALSVVRAASARRRDFREAARRARGPRGSRSRVVLPRGDLAATRLFRRGRGRARARRR